MSTCTATWVLLVKLNAPLLSGNVPEGVITVALKPDWNPVPVTVSVVGTFEVTVLGKIEEMEIDVPKITETLAVPLLPPLAVAVICASPAFIAVATPEDPTVATAALSEAQLNVIPGI